MAKRRSLGTRNSVPDPERAGFNSIIQNGNTDITSMTNMPVERRIVLRMLIDCVGGIDADGG